GQLDPENGSSSLLALHRDRAAVCLDDGPGDVQTEPGAGHLALARGRRAEETFEETIHLLPGDADSRVGHLEPDGAVPGPDGDANGAALGRELDRVRDE